MPGPGRQFRIGRGVTAQGAIRAVRIDCGVGRGQDLFMAPVRLQAPVNVQLREELRTVVRRNATGQLVLLLPTAANLQRAADLAEE